MSLSGKDFYGFTPLMQAVQSGQRELLETLLGLNPDLNERDNRGRTALMLASEKGDSFAVKLLLEKGADARAQDGRGQDALYYSLSVAHPESVRLLLEAGADPSARGERGVTTFMRAVANVSGEALDLLGQRANVNESDDWGKTALMHAVYEGNAAAVKWLLSRGADVRAADKKGATALFYLAVKEPSSVEFASLLLSAGADVKARNEAGDSPLTFDAGRTQFPDLLDVFLRAGADINELGAYKQNALLRALNNAAPVSMIEFLLDKGADPSVVDYYSEDALTKAASSRCYRDQKTREAVLALLRSRGVKTARMPDKEFVHLCWAGSADQIITALQDGANPNALADGELGINAVMRNKNLAVLQAFVRHGADLSKSDSDGMTPLLEAAKYNVPEIIRFLLANGSSFYEVDNKGQSAFIHSVMLEQTQGPAKTNPETLALFVELGADLEEKSVRDKRTAVGWAVLRENLPALRFLLEKGASADTPDQYGHTPIMTAVSDHPLPEIVDALLAAGADPARADRWGDTPYTKAQSLKRHAVLAVFEKYGMGECKPSPCGEPAPVPPELGVKEILSSGKPQEVEKLLKGGLNANAEVDGEPAAVIAARDNPFVQTLELLLKSGASWEQTGADGKTVKEHALVRGGAFERLTERYNG